MNDHRHPQLQQLLDEFVPPINGRRHERFPIWWELQLIPLDKNGNLVHFEAIFVVGKDVSVTGVGFSHNILLPKCRVAIALTDPKISRLAIEAEIIWTRRTPIGLYESGCRFIRKLAGHKMPWLK